jgi:NAD(P)-dependent dehydrogenase (short-subunit alcohol dehydrogenase family)
MTEYRPQSLRADSGDGLVALVTGASSGIGAATARLLAAHGAFVGLMARGPEALEPIAAELGERAISLPGDVAAPPEVEAALDRLEARFGPVTCAVNSAGVCWPVSLAELEPDSWREVIDINLSGTFYVARECGLRMRAGTGGSLINVASEMGTLGAAGYVAYCASKAGVLGLTRALAAELAPSVRVNAVCPGPIDTPMLDAEFEMSGDPQAALAETNERVPLGRRGTAEEVAEAIVFLAGSTYATGSAMALDGGTTII